MGVLPTTLACCLPLHMLFTMLFTCFSQAFEAMAQRTAAQLTDEQAALSALEVQLQQRTVQWRRDAEELQQRGRGEQALQEEAEQLATKLRAACATNRAGWAAASCHATSMGACVPRHAVLACIVFLCNMPSQAELSVQQLRQLQQQQQKRHAARVGGLEAEAVARDLTLQREEAQLRSEQQRVEGIVAVMRSLEEAGRREEARMGARCQLGLQGAVRQVGSQTCTEDSATPIEAHRMLRLARPTLRAERERDGEQDRGPRGSMCLTATPSSVVGCDEWRPCACAPRQAFMGSGQGCNAVERIYVACVVGRGLGGSIVVGAWSRVPPWV